MLPKETLLDILANLGRRDFDVLELVSRALGSLIAAKFNETPRRAVSLMFYEEGHVMATCPSVGWRRLLVIELPQHLPRSVIMKVTFKSLRGGTFTEEMYQGEESKQAHVRAVYRHFSLAKNVPYRLVRLECPYGGRGSETVS